eukprot:GHVN01093307.1.p1 GENE.GHVN01093307.1~~GHVN01093307.1.p1  ORF type:complete len:191 (+),score=0.85 GHVN01093307.1:32-604(+)
MQGKTFLGLEGITHPSVSWLPGPYVCPSSIAQLHSRVCVHTCNSPPGGHRLDGWKWQTTAFIVSSLFVPTGLLPLSLNRCPPSSLNSLLFSCLPLCWPIISGSCSAVPYLHVDVVVVHSSFGGSLHHVDLCSHIQTLAASSTNVSPRTSPALLTSLRNPLAIFALSICVQLLSAICFFAQTRAPALSGLG